jgi:hypothetical protein
LGKARKARLDHAEDKAYLREKRREAAKRKTWEAKPQPPSGLLARFKQQAYEAGLAQWRAVQARADRLHEQAEKTRSKIAYQRSDYSLKVWAEKALERIAPALVQRVKAWKAEERERRFAEQRQKQGQRRGPRL